MEIKIKATTVFERTYAEYKLRKNRILILEGGTGSSKSYSLAQLFAMIMLEENGVTITIARKTLPALKATAMKDFFTVLQDAGIYDENCHNKSDNTYAYKNNLVEFISVDLPMKVRSRRRDFLWMNEMNEFSKEDFRQLTMRTSRQIFGDYNPSDEYHWIYDTVLTREDCVLIRSTYLDNPFLPLEIVKEIEGYRDKDRDYWRIYGLGLRGTSAATVYTHWRYCDGLPEDCDERYYGLDFGHNHPSALVEIGEKDLDFYWDEIIYQSHLTNSDLIELLIAKKISKTTAIYADSAEPNRIAEIRSAGFNVVPAYKGKKLEGTLRDNKKSVHLAGVDFIKSHGFYITKSSINGLKEVKSYRWKVDKDGRILDEPVKVNDHFLDAGRYAIITKQKRARVSFVRLEESPIKLSPITITPEIVKPLSIKERLAQEREADRKMIEEEERQRLYN